MQRRAFGLAVLLVMLGIAPALAQLPPAVQQGRRGAEADCRGAGGRPNLMPAFQAELDLNGDGQQDYVHDFTGIDCEGAAGFFCGSAGCPVVVYVSPAYRAQPLGHSQAWTVDRSGRLPVIVLETHGSGCGRAGAQGCEQRLGWNGRELARLGAGRPAAPAAQAAPPPQAAQPAPAPPGGTKAPVPAAQAAPAPPAPPSQAWQVRQSSDGRTIAMVAGPGVVRAVSALCHMGTPVLALTLRARPPAGPVTLTLAGRGERASVGLTQLGSGETWIADLRGSAVPRLLSGQDSSLDLLINGGQQGRVSLQGSTRSVREALAGCGGA